MSDSLATDECRCPLCASPFSTGVHRASPQASHDTAASSPAASRGAVDADARPACVTWCGDACTCWLGPESFDLDQVDVAAMRAVEGRQ